MNARVPEVTWVRVPHQDRSRKTLERLLDTAEALLQERGFETVTVAEIAQAAGSSVGAFYARFRDKNGLLHHLHERFCEEAIATSDTLLEPGRWAGATAEQILGQVIEVLAGIHETRSGMLRAFMAVGQGDPQFLERDLRTMRHFLARLTALLMERRAEIGHPEPEVAIAFCIELCTAVLRDRFVLGTAQLGFWPTGQAGLVPELIRACARYLGLAPVGRAAAGEEPGCCA
jgi:AcrR family transcriptional regulator